MPPLTRELREVPEGVDGGAAEEDAADELVEVEVDSLGRSGANERGAKTVVQGPQLALLSGRQEAREQPRLLTLCGGI